MPTVSAHLYTIALSALLLTACAQPEAASTTDPEAEARFRLQRGRMVVEQIEARGIADPSVLAALRAVRRHAFVPKRYRRRAYSDAPLPIGEGQTISQPYVVALMSKLLDVKPGDKVLEVGTGSGYQAAVLDQMGARVYSIEIIPPLAQEAESAWTNRATVTSRPESATATTAGLRKPRSTLSSSPRPPTTSPPPFWSSSNPRAGW